MAKDALNIEKLNIGVCGKNKVIIRPGHYMKDGALVQQSMYFGAGKTLYVEVKRGTAINKAGIAGRTVDNHLAGRTRINLRNLYHSISIFSNYYKVKEFISQYFY